MDPCGHMACSGASWLQVTLPGKERPQTSAMLPPSRPAESLMNHDPPTRWDMTKPELLRRWLGSCLLHEFQNGHAAGEDVANRSYGGCSGVVVAEEPQSRSQQTTCSWRQSWVPLFHIASLHHLLQNSYVALLPPSAPSASNNQVPLRTKQAADHAIPDQAAC
jgi:hypothetical protein